MRIPMICGFPHRSMMLWVCGYPWKVISTYPFPFHSILKPIPIVIPSSIPNAPLIFHHYHNCATIYLGQHGLGFLLLLALKLKWSAQQYWNEATIVFVEAWANLAHKQCMKIVISCSARKQNTEKAFIVVEQIGKEHNIPSPWSSAFRAMHAYLTTPIKVRVQNMML